MPENWKEKEESLEMLFFFYQVSEELLNEKTPDSFALPMHNAITLWGEMGYMNELLNNYGLVGQYYSKYIPVIVDEFLSQLRSDSIIKKLLNYRYDSMLRGFEDAKNKPDHLNLWLESFQQAVPFNSYIDNLKSKIIELLADSKEKKELQNLTKNLYIMLIAYGYSKKYIRRTLLSFFKENEITSLKQIETFFSIFSFKKESYEFLILIDYNFFEFLQKVDPSIFEDLVILDVEKERELLVQNKDSQVLLAQYDRLVKKHADRKIHVAKWSTKSIDPYTAVKIFSENVSFLQTFPRYFNHERLQKAIYRFLVKRGDKYINVLLPNILNSKDSIDIAKIESFVKNIIENKSMSDSVNATIMQAMEMHSSAIEISKVMPLFQNFWTALETLFLSPNEKSVRENVNHSVVRIMQKIYTLKLYRALFGNVNKALSKDSLERLGVTGFRSFVAYVSSHDDSSEEMKKMYALLNGNPLLRFRLYTIKKECASEKAFCHLLETHQQRIQWHIERLYRMRNVATHLGRELPRMTTAVNHLHNYFDYVVNYILCKSSANNFVCGVASVVHEAKNDEEIHLSLIKEYKNISAENYMAWLFGPDEKMIDYTFDCL